MRGSFKSNVASGGNLTEVNLETLPNKIKNSVHKISNILYNRYDNPIYSIDFGVNRDGQAFVFEINDQMGFPKKNMVNKNLFLNELVKNIISKI